MARAVVAIGSAVSFVAAAVAGVLGNLLTDKAVWTWVAFGAALLIGAGVTAFVAYRTAADIEQHAEPAPTPHTVEGPVACHDVIIQGTYVAGHDLTVTDDGGEQPS